MKTVIYFCVLTILFLLVVYVDLCLSKNENVETFADTPLVEDAVIKTYNQVLDRHPNSKELRRDSAAIRDKTLTYDGLRQRLIDSDEYQRITKVQSNSLAPELPKMVSDRTILTRIAEVYKIENTRPLPKYMLFPLKDIYIRLDYNENALRAMYRTTTYRQFEEDVRFAKGLDYQDLMKLFDTYFNKDKLITAGAKLEPLPHVSAADPIGADIKNTKVQRTIHDTDSDSTQLLNSLLKGAGTTSGTLKSGATSGTSKSGATSGTSSGTSSGTKGANTCTTPVYVNVPTHQGDMVLDPKMAWSIPQPRPPVCTTFGQKQMIQPLYENSKLLLGTPLDEASDTSVGSIMPKFEYKEYVSIPVA